MRYFALVVLCLTAGGGVGLVHGESSYEGYETRRAKIDGLMRFASLALEELIFSCEMEIGCEEAEAAYCERHGDSSSRALALHMDDAHRAAYEDRGLLELYRGLALSIKKVKDMNAELCAD